MKVIEIKPDAIWIVHQSGHYFPLSFKEAREVASKIERILERSKDERKSK